MEEYIGIAAIAAATVTWLLTYFDARKARQVAHTADLISAISTSDRLAESSFHMTRLINNGTKVRLDSIDPAIESHVIDMLDYYEFLCDLYRRRVISRTTIKVLRGRLMLRTWVVCRDYIQDTREVQKRKVYDGYYHFVQELISERDFMKDSGVRRTDVDLPASEGGA